MIFICLGNGVDEPSSEGDFLKPPLERDWMFHSTIPHHCFRHISQCLIANYGKCWEGREQGAVGAGNQGPWPFLGEREGFSEEVNLEEVSPVLLAPVPTLLVSVSVLFDFLPLHLSQFMTTCVPALGKLQVHGVPGMCLAHGGCSRKTH